MSGHLDRVELRSTHEDVAVCFRPTAVYMMMLREIQLHSNLHLFPIPSTLVARQASCRFSDRTLHTYRGSANKPPGLPAVLSGSAYRASLIPPAEAGLATALVPGGVGLDQIEIVMELS